MSNLFLESMLVSFDSQAHLVWNLSSPIEASARFTVEQDEVTVIFVQVDAGHWRAAFEVASSALFSSEKASSFIRIFSGVFQAVEEILTIRQPERLVFASKEEGLGRLYEAYLSRQESSLRTLGYRPEPATKASPLAEYVIVKVTPSAWTPAR